MKWVKNFVELLKCLYPHLLKFRDFAESKKPVVSRFSTDFFYLILLADFNDFKLLEKTLGNSIFVTREFHLTNYVLKRIH